MEHSRMLDELKTCPFCGKEEPHHLSVQDVNGAVREEIWCMNDQCNAMMWAFDFDKVIEQWNTRAVELSPTYPLIVGKDDVCKIIPKDGWISVKDELPPVDKKVWCYVPQLDYDDLVFDEHYFEGSRITTIRDDILAFSDDQDSWTTVTHWMPLPKAPE